MLKTVQENLEEKTLPIETATATAADYGFEYLDAVFLVFPDRSLINDQVGWIIKNDQDVVDWYDDECKPAEGTHGHQRGEAIGHEGEGSG